MVYEFALAIILCVPLFSGYCEPVTEIKSPTKAFAKGVVLLGAVIVFADEKSNSIFAV